jgi:hypothetical protein
LNILPLDIQLSRGEGWKLACILLIKEIAYINSLWNINWNLKIKQETWYSRKENLPYENGSQNIIWNLPKYLSFIFIVWRYQRGIEKPNIHKSKTMVNRKRGKDKQFSTKHHTEIKYWAAKTLILISLKYIRLSKLGIDIFGSHLWHISYCT